MHTHSASTVEGYAGVSPHDEFSPGGSLHTKLPRSEARDALDTLLTTLIERGGSDLHLTAGTPPTIRINGDLTRLTDYADLTPEDTMRLVRSVVTPEQWLHFETEREFDLAYDVPGLSRFRVNLFQQRGSYGAVLRAIPHDIKPLGELGVPLQIEQFASLLVPEGAQFRPQPFDDLAEPGRSRPGLDVHDTGWTERGEVAQDHRLRLRRVGQRAAERGSQNALPTVMGRTEKVA